MEPMRWPWIFRAFRKEIYSESDKGLVDTAMAAVKPY